MLRRWSWRPRQRRWWCWALALCCCHLWTQSIGQACLKRPRKLLFGMISIAWLSWLPLISNRALQLFLKLSNVTHFTSDAFHFWHRSQNKNRNQIRRKNQGQVLCYLTGHFTKPLPHNPVSQSLIFLSQSLQGKCIC